MDQDSFRGPVVDQAFEVQELPEFSQEEKPSVQSAPRPNHQVVLAPISLGRKHKLDEILELINDPNSDPAEISRMIAVDIAEVAKEMADGMRDPLMVPLQKAYEIQIKALRELGKQLQEAEILSKKDVLNWEGAKFQFVLVELMKLFKQSLKDAGVEDSLAQNVLKHYRDLLGTNDVRMRRDMDKQLGGSR